MDVTTLPVAEVTRISDVPPGFKRAEWTAPALKVLRERYLRKEGEDRRIVETPEARLWATAACVASAERQYGTDEAEVHQLAMALYEIMADLRFLPNSPTLMNAGKGNNLQFSACFVLPVGDSMEEIFEAVKRVAVIHKSGGGTGFAFSRLRPKGSLVASSGGKASGPVSFMKVFNWATESVKQGGTRRGANMGILRVDHPDIEDFITCKDPDRAISELGFEPVQEQLDAAGRAVLRGAVERITIANFNISVGVTDEFMDALAQDREFTLRDPRDERPAKTLRAREIWGKIIQQAWKTGDPGVVFLDRINASPANPVPELEVIESTNPCGEQPLAPNDACNLGSINLGKFARDGEVDWTELARVVRLCVRFLDDVISVNPYPLPEIVEKVQANRRIGLGVMGWADLLAELGIPYTSEEAVELGKEVMEFIKRIGHEESIRLAETRGPFPNWPRSIYREGSPRRNSTVTTIAPTGTISVIAGCSSGIEPLFSVVYEHKAVELIIVNPTFRRIAEKRGFWTENLPQEILANKGLRGLTGIPDDIREVFATANEIDLAWHIRHQAAFQAHTDNGVSKTINLPHSATPKDVDQAYRRAWELGCLGITVFRDGCKEEQVLATGERKADGMTISVDGRGRSVEIVPEQFHAGVKERPAWLNQTRRIETPVGTAYITVNDDGRGPFEVFVDLGKGGTDGHALAEAIGREMSLVLRLQSPVSQWERAWMLAKQNAGIGGRQHLGMGPQRVRSVPDAAARAIAEYLAFRAGDRCPVEIRRAAEEFLRGDPIAEEQASVPQPVAQLVGAVESEWRLRGGGDICPLCGEASVIEIGGCLKCTIFGCPYKEC